MATDKQLIQQILLGRSEAFGELFRKYQKQIYFICQGIVKNSHDAEELVQESFVHAYLKLYQLEDPDKFLLWLKKIAQNRSKNYLRRKREITIPLTQVNVPAMHSTPDRLLLKQELIDAITEAIESLPKKDRELIRAHIDGLSHSEISERFGISIQASKDRLYRVRKKIKTHLKDLLNTIIGLPKILPSEKIISGGISAMKIGTSTKVTIGVIGILVAGFIGFQTMMRHPDIKPPAVETQQPITTKVERGDKTVAENKFLSSESSHQRSDVGSAMTPDKQDAEQLDEREIEEFLAWLDDPAESSSMDEEEVRQESEKPEEEEITEPMSQEAPQPEEFVREFLIALGNINVDALLSMTRGQARELFEKDSPGPKDIARMRRIRATNGRLVNGKEYRFNLLIPMKNRYVEIEIVMHREEGRWWIDEIPFE